MLPAIKLVLTAVGADDLPFASLRFRPATLDRGQPIKPALAAKCDGKCTPLDTH